MEALTVKIFSFIYKPPFYKKSFCFGNGSITKYNISKDSASLHAKHSDIHSSTWENLYSVAINKE